MIIMNTSSRPAPAEFTCYRQYLRSMVRYLKETQRSFSYRNFARKAGYSSPNFLKLVADGKRNLSNDGINRFARGLGLTPREREDFENLVFLGRAQTDNERNYYYQRLCEQRPPVSKTAQIEREQYEVYSLWYAIPIRELMLEDDFQEDPVWICRQFHKRITPSEARHGLELLQRTGLAARDAKGRLRPKDTKLATPSVAGSLAVRNYHRAMLEQAQESLDGIPVEHRNITSVTLRLTPEQYDMACQKVSDFRQQLLDEIEESSRGGEPGDITVIGFQLFPLTRRTRS